MRVFIGGVPTLVPARWYWCAPGALPFPGQHGCQASWNLQNGEVNSDFGEVTPWPRDPDSNYFSGLDRGLNPGYPGRCFTGDPQWFQDWQLPAGILTGAPQPFQACCAPNVGLASGGIVLSGSGLVTAPVCQFAGLPVQVDFFDGQGLRQFVNIGSVGVQSIYALHQPTLFAAVPAVAIGFRLGRPAGCIGVGFASLRASPPFPLQFSPIGVVSYFNTQYDAVWSFQGDGTLLGRVIT